MKKRDRRLMQIRKDVVDNIKFLQNNEMAKRGFYSEINLAKRCEDLLWLIEILEGQQAQVRKVKETVWDVYLPMLRSRSGRHEAPDPDILTHIIGIAYKEAEKVFLID